MKKLPNKTYTLTPPSTVTCDGNLFDDCTSIKSFSSDGLGWGDDGEGATQLAMALMVSEFGINFIEHPIHYMDLRRDFVSKLKANQSHTITTRQILDCVKEIVNAHQI